MSVQSVESVECGQERESRRILPRSPLSPGRWEPARWPQDWEKFAQVELTRSVTPLAMEGPRLGN
jgi:hypothetical protein